MEVKAGSRVATEAGLVVGFAVDAVGGSSLTHHDSAKCGVDSLVDSECCLVLTDGAFEVEAGAGVAGDAGLVVGFTVEAVGGLARDDGAECRVDALVGHECSLVLAHHPVQVVAGTRVTGDAGHVVGLTIDAVGGSSLTHHDGAECGVDAFVSVEHPLVLADRSMEVVANTCVTCETDLVVCFTVETVGGSSLAGDDGAECGIDTFVSSQCCLVLADCSLQIVTNACVTTEAGQVVGFAVDAVGGSSLTSNNSAKCGVDAFVSVEHPLVLADRSMEVVANTRVT